MFRLLFSFEVPHSEVIQIQVVGLEHLGLYNLCRRLSCRCFDWSLRHNHPPPFILFILTVLLQGGSFEDALDEGGQTRFLMQSPNAS